MKIVEKGKMDKSNYTHLLYVRKYSIFSNDYELYVYGVKTKDIYHTIGEMHARSLEHIKRIDWVVLTPQNRQAKFDYWKEQGKQIHTWYDKHEL